MKNTFVVLFLIILSFKVYSQSTPQTAMLMNSYYLGGYASWNNADYGPQIAGVDYGCLNTRSNFVWGFFPVCDSTNTGNLELDFIGMDSIGYVLYGPFNDTTNIASKLLLSTPRSCSNYRYNGGGFPNNLINFPIGVYYIAFSGNQNSFNNYTSQISFASATSSIRKFCNFCNQPYESQVEVCLLTTDSATQRNKIIFDKGDTTNIAGYIIFRENNISGQYDSLDFIDVDSLNYYLDMSANPSTRNWRYMIHKYDKCGFRLPSYYQGGAYVYRYNTIHLQQAVSTNNSINLTWNNVVNNVPFIGEPPYVLSFFIYRSNGVDPFVCIDSIPFNGFNAYTDVNPNQGTNLYEVAIRLVNACNITRTGISESRSNMISTNFTGIFEPSKHNMFKIYPNPANENVSFELSNTIKNFSLSVVGIDGRLFTTITGNGGGDYKLDLSEYCNGYYLIDLVSDNVHYYSKLIIRK